MQITLAAAVLVATTAASGLAQRNVDVQEFVNHNATCDLGRAFAKVVNRCSYPVYLWSIGKQFGCPTGTGLKLNTGDFYHENYQNTTFEDDGGISIKLSKFEECGGKDITQLEYKLVDDGIYGGNYLDMSFVDCTENLEDCPGRTDGFYLKVGNKDGKFFSSVNNEHCPIFNVHDAEDAAKVSYIKWDDRQTKYCDKDASLELYLCGGDAPDADDYTPIPASSATPSSSQPQSSPGHSGEQEPTPSAPAAPSTTEEAYVVAAAAVTEPPSAPAPVVKTEVVYVTEYVNKRHAHGRRHQHFHA